MIGRIKDEDDGLYKSIGRIEYVNLGVEDHGILHLTLGFDFGGSGQGYQVVLDDPVKTKDGKMICRMGTAFGCELIRRICYMFSVDTIQDLVGPTAFALYDTDDYSSFIKGIENPTFNKSHSRIRKVITQQVIKEVEEVQKIEKGELPFREVEWS